MTVVSPDAVLSVAKGDDSPALDAQTKREIAKAIAQSYESLRDLPAEIQSRVLVACAVLLGRADDVVDRLTGKVRS